MEAVHTHLESLTNTTSKEVWYHKSIETTRQLDRNKSIGVAFASKTSLELLQQRGCFAMMDATHKTNWLGWLLYTISVRNNEGSWLPVAHFLTKEQDGDIIAASLIQIKQWCVEATGKPWDLRYFLTDDSAAEQKAMRIAFRCLEAGETEVQHFLCQVHSERTLRRQLAGKQCEASLGFMLAALKYRRTQAGCLDSIKAAIEAAPNKESAKYIQQNWLPNLDQWAYCARDTSARLLQASSSYLRIEYIAITNVLFAGFIDQPPRVLPFSPQIQ